MAIALESRIPQIQATGDINQSVSIPAATTLLVMVVHGFHSSPSISGTPTIGGSAFTAEASSVTGSANSCFLFTKANPATGSPTLVVDLGHTWTEGGFVDLLCYSGTTSIRDSDAGASTSSGGTVSLTLDSQSGDLGVIIGSGYLGSIDVDLNDQTRIWEDSSAYNSDLSAGATKSATGTSLQLQLTGEWPGAAAVTLIPAGGSPTFRPAWLRKPLSNLGTGVR